MTNNYIIYLYMFRKTIINQEHFPYQYRSIYRVSGCPADEKPPLLTKKLVRKLHEALELASFVYTTLGTKQGWRKQFNFSMAVAPETAAYII